MKAPFSINSVLYVSFLIFSFTFKNQNSFAVCFNAVATQLFEFSEQLRFSQLHCDHCLSVDDNITMASKYDDFALTMSKKLVSDVSIMQRGSKSTLA